MSWYSKADDGLILNLHIVPRSSKTEICGTHDNALKIKLQAPPLEGKANKALIKFMAKTLSIRQHDITILSGESARSKRIKVKCQTDVQHYDMLIQRLLP